MNVVIIEALIEHPAAPDKVHRNASIYPMAKWNWNTTITAIPGYVIVGVLIVDDDQAERIMSNYGKSIEFANGSIPEPAGHESGPHPVHIGEHRALRRGERRS